MTAPSISDRLTDGERITELERRLALLEMAVRLLSPTAERLARDIRHAQAGGTQ